MNLDQKKTTASLLAIIIFAAFLWWGLINNNWNQAPESLRPLSTHDWAGILKDPSVSDLAMKVHQEYVPLLVTSLKFYEKFCENFLVAGTVAWFNYFLALFGLDLIVPGKEET